jgi:hypothetical protein
MAVTPNKWVMRFLVASATAMVILGIFGIQSQGFRSDWLGFYTAGKFIIEGSAGDLYRPDLIHAWQEPLIGDYIIQFLYAPAFAIFYAPLAIFPLGVARVIWLVVGLVAALAAAWISTRWSGLSKPVSMLGMIAFPPLAYSLAVGQNSALTLLIFTAVAWLEWKGRQDYLPGLFVGLALYKPQLLIPILLFWLVNKRWRTLIGLVVAATVVATLSLIINPQATLEYIQFTFEFFRLAEYSNASGANISFYAIWPALGIVVSFVVIVLLIQLGRAENTYLVMAIVWLAPVLVTPYIVIYDMLLLVIPISFLVPILRDKLELQVGVGMVWFACLLAIPIQSTRPVMWAAFGLFLICTWLIFRSQQNKEVSEKPTYIESTG